MEEAKIQRERNNQNDMSETEYSIEENSTDSAGDSCYIGNPVYFDDSDRPGKKYRQLTITGVNIVLFAFAILFISYQLLVSLIAGGEVLTDNIYITLAINQLVVILLPAVIYVLVRKVNIKEAFRFHKFSPLAAIIIVFAAMPAYFTAVMLNSLGYYLLQFIGNIPGHPFPTPHTNKEYIVGLIMVGLLPAVCEEIMHRGLILKAYERRGTYRALFISSLFFGLFHFDITNLLGTMFLGLVIGFYVIRTNSIFAGMLAHFMNNALAMTIMYLARNNPNPDSIVITTADLVQTVFIGVTSLLFLGILIFAFLKVTAGKWDRIIKHNIKKPISSVARDITSIASHWPIAAFLILYLIFAVIYIVSISVYF
jgi:membrane protease YdiL (CAAX protease family)